MTIAADVIAVLLALAFLAAGGAKIAGAPMMRESASHFGIPFNQYRGIGVLEIAGVLGLAIGFANKNLGIAAAICLCLLVIGAAITHLRAGDSLGKAMPAVVLAILCAAYVWLRLA